MKLIKKDSSYVLYKSKKIKAIEMLGGKCINCGADNHICLEFHHKNKNEKEHKIVNVLHMRWGIAEKELKKCILMCRNCHMEEHYPDASKMKIEILKIMDKVVVCEKCGYDKNYAALDFHHTDVLSKKFSFRDVHNDHMFLMPLEKIVEEMAKCKLLCRNCHSIEHYDIKKFLKFKEQINIKINSYNEHQPIDWIEVKNMKKNGLKNIEIARKIGCSKGSVTYILQNG